MSSHPQQKKYGECQIHDISGLEWTKNGRNRLAFVHKGALSQFLDIWSNSPLQEEVLPIPLLLFEIVYNICLSRSTYTYIHLQPKIYLVLEAFSIIPTTVSFHAHLQIESYSWKPQKPAKLIWNLAISSCIVLNFGLEERMVGS